MKRVLAFILSLTIMVSSACVTSFAAETDYAGNEYYVENEQLLSWYIDAEGGTLYVNGTGDMRLAENEIPFEWLSYDFTAVEIGEGITSVEEEAFLYAENLQSVKLSSTVKTIGERAFYNCFALSEVDFAGVESIGTMAFYGCNNLSSVFVPETVTEIGNYAIGYYCDEEKDIPYAKNESVMIYGTKGSAAEAYAFENEILFVDVKDFSSYFSYELVDDENAKLTGYVDCPYSVDVIIPDSIDGYNVVDLGEFLFEGSAAQSVYIPASVTGISSLAFEKASNLKAINAEGNKNFASFDGVLYNGKLTAVLKCPEGKTSLEAFHENATEIKSGAFKYSSVSEINIPEKISVLGEGAFMYSDLTEIALSENVTAIPAWCFAGTLITEFNAPQSVKAIDDNAFSCCGQLNTVKLPAGLESIGASAFYNTALANVTIPNATKQIGEKAFGYKMYQDVEFVKNEEFVLCGKTGTAGYDYAEVNGFAFEDVAPSAPQIWHIYADNRSVTLFWEQISDADYYEVYRKTKDVGYTKIAEVSGSDDTVFCDMDVKNGTTYRYSVVAVKGVLNSGIEKSEAIKFVKLSTPGLVSAALVKEGISVKWKTVKNAEGYILYRKAENGSWKQLADFSGKVSVHLDTTVKGGVKYTYTVRAYKGEAESGYDADGVSAVYLSVPELTSAENTTKGIKVKWQKVSGTTGYIISRKTADGSWKEIAQVENVASYTDKSVKPGEKFTYTVIPVKDDFKGFCDEKGVTCKFIQRPEVTGIEATAYGVRLSWKPVAKCSGYIVYRKTGNGDWVRLAKTDNKNASSYVDQKAKSGKEYTYIVRAHSGGYKSYYNAPAGEITYIEAPNLVGVNSKQKGIKVKWDTVGGADGYIIYRKTADGKYARVGKVKDADAEYFYDKTAKKGKTYYYAVVAYKGSTKSIYSASMKCKCKY